MFLKFCREKIIPKAEYVCDENFKKMRPRIWKY